MGMRSTLLKSVGRSEDIAELNSLKFVEDATSATVFT